MAKAGDSASVKIRRRIGMKGNLDANQELRFSRGRGGMLIGGRCVDHRGTLQPSGIDEEVHNSHTESEGDCREHLSSTGNGRRGTAH